MLKCVAAGDFGGMRGWGLLRRALGGGVQDGCRACRESRNGEVVWQGRDGGAGQRWLRRSDGCGAYENRGAFYGAFGQLKGPLAAEEA